MDWGQGRGVDRPYIEEEREDVHVRSIQEDAKKGPGILMDSRSFGLPESWKSVSAEAEACFCKVRIGATVVEFGRWFLFLGTSLPRYRPGFLSEGGIVGLRILSKAAGKWRQELLRVTDTGLRASKSHQVCGHYWRTAKLLQNAMMRDQSWSSSFSGNSNRGRSSYSSSSYDSSIVFLFIV